MGKPTTTQPSRNSSTHSIHSTMSKEKVFSKIAKMEHHRKFSRKTNQSIRKLINYLSNTSQNPSLLQNSDIIDLEDSNTTLTPRLEPVNEVSIVISDDDQQACSTPKKLNFLAPNLLTSTPNSTPTRKPSSRLDDFILACSNNNLQNSVDRNSLQTIDLTGFNDSSRIEPTVIEIDDTTDEVELVSASNASSMSGDSDVTILQQPIRSGKTKFSKHIMNNLNVYQKRKLLKFITRNIFHGCNVPMPGQSRIPAVQNIIPRAPKTLEDTYIKDVILRGKESRLSIGSNIYHPDRPKNMTGKRMVVIDGSNVAMQCKYGKSSDPRLLDHLERLGHVVYTPSREVQGRSIVPYDDRYIVQCAAEFDGVIVSGDNYRDIAHENLHWRAVIETRLLPFTWVDNMVMFPRDPLGRDGPTLEQFLTH